MMRLSVALALALLLLTGYACENEVREDAPVEASPSILGSWDIKSIYWITGDTTYAIDDAQPGMLLLTPDRYAIMWTPTQEPRVPFQVLSAPTDEEVKAGFRSIVFNGGTYEHSDSTLTTTAHIAKVPGFEGGRQFYRYVLSGDVLELTMFDEIYPDGTRPEWYGKYETKFVLERVR